MNKYARQSKILDFIKTHEVKTQEELSALLISAGFDVTQATVSRDIRELRLIKTMSITGAYQYALAPEGEQEGMAYKLSNIFSQSVSSVDYAGNLVVLKTMPGMAQAAGAAVDALHHEEIVGSIAGDDTLLIVLRDEKEAGKLCARFKRLA